MRSAATKGIAQRREFLFLKANQPFALAKGEQLLPGKLPPSG